MKTNAILSLGLAAFMGLGAVLPAAAATASSTTTAATTASTASTASTATTPAAAPAKAATKTIHYYVALKAKGPGCEVVEAKPSTKLMVSKHVYKTESDAEKALKDAKACRA